MSAFWTWYNKPVRPRWVYLLLTALVLFAGMFVTTTYWRGSVLMTVLVAAVWGFVGTVCARLILGWVVK